MNSNWNLIAFIIKKSITKIYTRNLINKSHYLFIINSYISLFINILQTNSKTFNVAMQLKIESNQIKKESRSSIIKNF